MATQKWETTPDDADVGTMLVVIDTTNTLGLSFLFSLLEPPRTLYESYFNELKVNYIPSPCASLNIAPIARVREEAHNERTPLPGILSGGEAVL